MNSIYCLFCSHELNILPVLFVWIEYIACFVRMNLIYCLFCSYELNILPVLVAWIEYIVCFVCVDGRYCLVWFGYPLCWRWDSIHHSQMIPKSSQTHTTYQPNQAKPTTTYQPIINQAKPTQPIKPTQTIKTWTKTKARPRHPNLS